jgi:DNA-directed RNA polymerase specialized sigma24 family protein
VLGFGGEREAVSKVGLTAADLHAARRREPAAVSRVYTAYAPALFRFFMAAVGDRHQAEDPEELAIDRLEGSRVLAGLRQLSPDQREVLLLRMAAGLTAPEVAALVGKSTGAVKALQHRGLASLARVLGLRGPGLDGLRPYPSADPNRLTSEEEEER